MQTIQLQPRSVANFYQAVMDALASLDLAIVINTVPNEVTEPIPFERDETHNAYDADYANRFWRILQQSERIFREFRSFFRGKVSPISDKLSVKASCQEGKGDKSRGSLARFGRGDLTIPKSRFSGT
ncbi:hypothetical protein IQ238_19785, partial [Pleurocapsales cyanobacterium LEGE 06147]|nr:hypothetical protein [Pleurocapsales cyanobacterium LEGE 06147]